jgi:hypothetical protein
MSFRRAVLYTLVKLAAPTEQPIDFDAPETWENPEFVSDFMHNTMLSILASSNWFTTDEAIKDRITSKLVDLALPSALQTFSKRVYGYRVSNQHAALMSAHKALSEVLQTPAAQKIHQYVKIPPTPQMGEKQVHGLNEALANYFENFGSDESVKALEFLKAVPPSDEKGNTYVRVSDKEKGNDIIEMDGHKYKVLTTEGEKLQPWQQALRRRYFAPGRYDVKIIYPAQRQYLMLDSLAAMYLDYILDVFATVETTQGKNAAAVLKEHIGFENIAKMSIPQVGETLKKAEEMIATDTELAQQLRDKYGAVNLNSIVGTVVRNSTSQEDRMDLTNKLDKSMAYARKSSADSNRAETLLTAQGMKSLSDFIKDESGGTLGDVVKDPNAVDPLEYLIEQESKWRKKFDQKLALSNKVFETWNKELRKVVPSFDLNQYVTPRDLAKMLVLYELQKHKTLTSFQDIDSVEATSLDKFIDHVLAASNISAKGQAVEDTVKKMMLQSISDQVAVTPTNKEQLQMKAPEEMKIPEGASIEKVQESILNAMQDPKFQAVIKRIMAPYDKLQAMLTSPTMTKLRDLFYQGKVEESEKPRIERYLTIFDKLPTVDLPQKLQQLQDGLVQTLSQGKYPDELLVQFFNDIPDEQMTDEAKHKLARELAGIIAKLVSSYEKGSRLQ